MGGRFRVASALSTAQTPPLQHHSVSESLALSEAFLTHNLFSPLRKNVSYEYQLLKIPSRKPKPPTTTVARAATSRAPTSARHSSFAGGSLPCIAACRSPDRPTGEPLRLHVELPFDLRGIMAALHTLGRSRPVIPQFDRSFHRISWRLPSFQGRRWLLLPLSIPVVLAFRQRFV